jgi:short subunit dehydrogenase-like uncharacterized protein
MVGPSSTHDPLLLYGATGYTGRLLAEGLRARGLRPLLAARDPTRLAGVAAPLDLPHRAVGLDAPEGLDRALAGVRVVLNAAGPFAHTARPLVDACLRVGAHYLDITGELDVFEGLARRHAEARSRSVMIMPGVGFDVVATDCQAAHVAAHLPGARRLRLGVTGLAPASRGSARTVIEHVGTGTRVRRGGVIRTLPMGALERSFDFGRGPRPSLAVSWGDVSTAFYTTGIPDIEVYYEASPELRATAAVGRWLGGWLRLAPWQAWLQGHADVLPAGPSETQRGRHRCVVVAEVEDDAGGFASSRLESPEGYGFTALSAPAIAARVLADDLEPGFQTPARVYGADFVLSIPGTVRENRGSQIGADSCGAGIA